jgi:hypothetical protein
MEPISRRERAVILATNPAATEEDIDEYERLLVRRFMTDPDAEVSPDAPVTPQGAHEDIERRLDELREKLFGKP